MMFRYFALLLFLGLSPAVRGQASVAYYPFNSRGLFTVSTNPDRLLWLDGRLQTNSIFEQLSTTFCGMVNVRRTERVNYYVGPGVQLNALNTLNGDRILEGYSLHVGVRAAPVTSLHNLCVAFELSPTAQANFKSGVFYSYLGVAWHFRKRAQ